MKALIEEQREAWRSGNLPPSVRVADGIWAIAIPCEPFPVRFTYCYVIEDAGDLLVVDPGLHSPAGWAALVDGLAVMGRTPSDVTGVVATHFHPDHIGMASTLATQSNAWVATHESEIDLIRVWKTSSFDDLKERDARWLDAGGVPEDDRERLAVDVRSGAFLNSIELPNRALVDGDVIVVGTRSLLVVHTPGHTPGHICLVDDRAKVVLTGDHVLPGISPNVGLHSVDEASDPVSGYLKGLAALARLDQHDVLPAHEYAFRGLSSRASDLARHHRDRAEEIEATLAGGELTPWELAGRISWSRAWETFNPVNTRLALAETHAHLRRLERIGRIEARGDARGRMRWRRTDQAD